ncbi:DUF4190 domain-containing protein [Microbacterium hibisci]|uniref:DUF4190 domain-containing protein n=1 Tax=Microbacterium hibisci TaxID=2036000 RepID=UPI0027DA60F6|nr:DUF4190 domain-containing protein [Microbacterium hibisci]
MEESNDLGPPASVAASVPPPSAPSTPASDADGAARPLSERGTSETKRVEDLSDLGPTPAPDGDGAPRSLSERGTSETKRAEESNDLGPTPTPAAASVPPPPARPKPAPVAASVPPAAAARPTVEAPSPDVDLTHDATPLPGAHRGGFSRLPTAPVAVTVETAPAEPGGEFTPDDTQWRPAEPAEFHRGLGVWALAFAIVGLIVSLFVGWGFPIGLIAVVSGIIALRRPLESRAVAVWAIVLGVVSILYSAGWLLYAGFRLNFFG